MVIIPAKLKIVIVVGISLALSACFALFHVYTTINNQERILSIQTTYFPILEKFDQSIVLLDKLKDRIERAVVTSDADLLDEANSIREQCLETFLVLKEFIPLQEKDISRIEALEQQYYELALMTAKGYMELELPLEEVKKNVRVMNKYYDRLLSETKEIREYSYSEFTRTLSESNESANKMVRLGFIVGILNLAFIFGLAYSVHRNIDMMQIIKKQNKHLEKTVAERTALLVQKSNAMKLMLKNMRQGVFTISDNLTIEAEYSNYLETLVGKEDLDGQCFFDLILNNSDLSADKIEQIRSCLLAAFGANLTVFQFNLHILVREITLNYDSRESEPKILELDWVPIVNEENIVEKMMIIGRDVTEIRMLHSESGRQKKELAMIGEVLDVSPAIFEKFMSDSSCQLKEIYSTIEKMKELDISSESPAYVKLHTIKGNTRTFGLTYLSEVLHLVEDSYVRASHSDRTAEDKSQLMARILDAQVELDSYNTIYQQKLGAYSNTTVSQSNFLNAIQRHVDRLQNESSVPVHLVEGLKGEIRYWNIPSLRDLLNPIQNGIDSAAHDLKKEKPVINLTGGELKIDPDIQRPLSDIIMHCLRNSIDHGIELPAVRQSKGKSGYGTISINANKEAEKFKIIISDDGKGLDLDKLKSLGKERNLITTDSPSDESLAELIFTLGLSTKTVANVISGRGVGMEAVLLLTHELGGKIAVQFTGEKKRLDMHRSFCLKIELPGRYLV